jgi:hypothetical protein
MCLYRDYFVHHRKSEFRMETERVDEPRLISGSYASIVEFNAVICSGNIVPGPVSIQPIVEILLNIKKHSINLKNKGQYFIFSLYMVTTSSKNTEMHLVVNRWRT